MESESSEDEVDELEGADLVESLRKEIKKRVDQATQTPYEKISNGNLTESDWKKAEQNQGLRYNGLASWTQRKHRQNARQKVERDKITRKS